MFDVMLGVLAVALLVCKRTQKRANIRHSKSKIINNLVKIQEMFIWQPSSSAVVNSTELNMPFFLQWGSWQIFHFVWRNFLRYFAWSKIFFGFSGASKTNVHFHADNCGGQNKTMCFGTGAGVSSMAYMRGCSFLVAGHTKFGPNWCLGLMSQRLQRTIVSSLFDILEANNMSTQNGMNCGKLVGLHDSTVLVKTYDWESYLASYLKKKITGISKLYHLSFTKNDPGKGFYREYADSPKREFQMLKDINQLPPRVLPPQVLPSGLDEERKRYLHKEI